MATTSPRDGKAERLVPRQGIPPWVKVFAAVGLVLVVLFVALHLTGHGFGNHSLH